MSTFKKESTGFHRQFSSISLSDLFYLDFWGQSHEIQVNISYTEYYTYNLETLYSLTFHQPQLFWASLDKFLIDHVVKQNEWSYVLYFQTLFKSTFNGRKYDGICPNSINMNTFTSSNCLWVNASGSNLFGWVHISQ